MKSHTWLLLLAVVSFWGMPAASAYETDVLTRDPSTIVKSGKTYWIYGTGKGIPQFSSTDRVHWTARGPVLPTAPAWVAPLIPANTKNFVWAPDLHFVGGKWRLYYSYSTFGANTSCIGTATNDTLNPRTWVDGGLIVRTGADTNDNAIDPCIFEDAAHRLWLSFGSYFSGIKLMQIDPATGRQDAAHPTLYTLAFRSDSPGNALEASAITYHDGYYYLFVNWDACCRGAKSTYNIRVGRSPSVTGPYRDKMGKDMLAGGGTLFLGSLPDNGSGNLCDDQVGPGHAGILHDTDGDWVSFHEEWTRDKGGATTVDLLRLAWDGDGWPRAILDPGPYKIVSNLATHNLLSVTGDASLQTRPDEGGGSQKWTLSYRGDGFYSLLVGASRRALSVVGAASRAGAKVGVAVFDGRDGQLWSVRRNEDGTWALLPKSGGQATVLDIGGCNASDNAPVGLWTDNGLPCQGWSFHAR